MDTHQPQIVDPVAGQATGKALIGRIQPGVHLKQAESELFAIYKAREEEERRTAANQRYVNSARPVFLLPAARGH